jgi:hypothetical protein
MRPIEVVGKEKSQAILTKSVTFESNGQFITVAKGSLIEIEPKWGIAFLEGEWRRFLPDEWELNPNEQ